ncbi:MAG: hypothetical protein O9284_01810 [Steroidobacteraceae bacterium]|nr:hypothetical protein [Steroidobacteraceae bacterium]
MRAAARDSRLPPRRAVALLAAAALGIAPGAGAEPAPGVAASGGLVRGAAPHVDRPGTAVVPPGVPDGQELEALGATIGTIELHVQNIFDTSDPREDGWLYRTANALHLKTRDATVRQQLLFAEGARFDARLLEETERILRSRRYLVDAWVVPVRYDPARNVVDVSVTVRDVWTLNPGVSFNRAGGENRTRFEIEEQNLLGTGTKLSLGRSRDVDRSSTLLQYSDPNLGTSWWQLDLAYSDNSDGNVHSAGLQRPFYALDVRHAYGFTGYSGESVVSRYDRGRIVDQFQGQRHDYAAWVGWSDGLVDGVVRRWYAGVRHQHADFARRPELPLQPARLPAARKFAYPWIGWQFLEDRYAEGANLDLIGRTEDLYLGRSAYLELGWSSRSFGADQDAILARARGLAGWRLDERRQLFVNAALDGRLEGGVARNVVGSLGGRYFWRLTDRQLLYAALSGVATQRLDAERQVLLGGEEGLRGYPLRFQGGTSSLLFTVEHRVFTDWYPFRLVRVGGAAFVDVGRTWGRSLTGAEPLGRLSNVGFGLRLGNNRTGLGNVLHVDVSYALDAPPGVKRLEVTVETRERF